MKNKKQNAGESNKILLLVQKGYKRLVYEIVPVQQTATYNRGIKQQDREAVDELTADVNNTECKG